MESSWVGFGEKRKEREEHGGFFSSGHGDFYDHGERAWQGYYSHFRAPGIGGVMPMRAFPFTCAQWQELQRQALIYKYIVASVPVPPDLLLPVSARAFPEAPPFLLPSTVVGGPNAAAGFNMRFTNNMDPEPGRCRRTDGKKWRCSRDAAPDQKYCERHMHRGRPRSRKPVELRKTTKSTPVASTVATPSASFLDKASNTCPSIGLLPKVDLKLPFLPMEPTKDVKNTESNQEHWNFMNPNTEMRNEAYSDLTNFNYTDLNLQCCTFLNTTISPPRTFIDAWSTDNEPDEPVPTLTLSMSNPSEPEKVDPKWMGGPLAEVLHSTNGVGSKSKCHDLINLMSKSCCASQDAASSPSGVLQKALVSPSDSSSSSSPTFGAFQWMK